MSQPKWKLIANLGDVNPFEYGGYFVFVDETGEYPPEAEVLEILDENDNGTPNKYEVHRFILEPCTFVNGVLSDNSFHPDFPAWFADSLDGICSSMDVKKEELIRLFCSDDPVERAQAWRNVGEYHGYVNLDEYPLTLNRKEVWGRYTSRLRALRKAS